MPTRKRDETEEALLEILRTEDVRGRSLWGSNIEEPGLGEGKRRRHRRNHAASVVGKFLRDRVFISKQSKRDQLCARCETVGVETDQICAAAVKELLDQNELTLALHMLNYVLGDGGRLTVMRNELEDHFGATRGQLLSRPYAFSLFLDDALVGEESLENYGSVQLLSWYRVLSAGPRIERYACAEGFFREEEGWANWERWDRSDPMFHYKSGAKDTCLDRLIRHVRDLEMQWPPKEEELLSWQQVKDRRSFSGLNMVTGYTKYHKGNLYYFVKDCSESPEGATIESGKIYDERALDDIVSKYQREYELEHSERKGPYR